MFGFIKKVDSFLRISGLICYAAYIKLTGKEKEFYAKMEANQARRDAEMAELDAQMAELDAISDRLDEINSLVDEMVEASKSGDTSKHVAILEKLIVDAKKCDMPDFVEMFEKELADVRSGC